MLLCPLRNFKTPCSDSRCAVLTYCVGCGADYRVSRSIETERQLVPHFDDHSRPVDNKRPAEPNSALRAARVLAIGFDGVIHDKAHPVPGRRMGGPMPGAERAMTALHAGGCRLIVHCVWADSEHNRRVICDWLSYYMIPFDEITNIKPAADVYLDDKAVRFASWVDFMAQWA